ncbi:hypothetical protein CPHO_03610 [Corynebacterium phocae]|uniref:Glycosyl transferase family 1 domain-containing protein n=1 Tax=Corynebacterium phocae TaxID=161895 RepID=A0A1L7D1X2_9CORY|nr:glycosyltransferase family 4 protein [Corynebacterium phocae]APT92129.1 hypothetical protein CPHO_03610 [Corynebacterium phocae]KAA8726516.1 glycosyltransferase family 4 protein [Corynebacterium phocae]
MHILVISQYWFPENGVPQRRWTWLASLFRVHGAEISVIAPPPHYLRRLSVAEWLKSIFRGHKKGHETGSSGERIFRTFYLPTGQSLTVRAVSQLVASGAAIWTAFWVHKVGGERVPDVIIGTVPALPTAVATLLISKLLKRPYWIDLRDAWPDLLSNRSRWNENLGRLSVHEKIFSKGIGQVVSYVTDWVLNCVFYNAEGLIVTSSELAATLKSKKHKTRSGHHIVTIRNVFPVQSDLRRGSLPPRGEKGLHVLYAGTLGRAQNLANAVRAAGIARDHGFKVELRFVGAGAAKESLEELAAAEGIESQFEVRKPASQLDDHYRWADTALVHLTDWEPLRRAVPSKTYELMEVGIHISGVVSGEAASIILDNNAGHVVSPESPEALAALWEYLIENPEKLKIGNGGRTWVARERSEIAPALVERLVNGVFRIGS